jgi:hypothetical protein
LTVFESSPDNSPSFSKAFPSSFIPRRHFFCAIVHLDPRLLQVSSTPQHYLLRVFPQSAARHRWLWTRLRFVDFCYARLSTLRHHPFHVSSAPRCCPLQLMISFTSLTALHYPFPIRVIFSMPVLSDALPLCTSSLPAIVPPALCLSLLSFLLFAPVAPPAFTLPALYLHPFPLHPFILYHFLSFVLLASQFSHVLISASISRRQTPGVNLPASISGPQPIAFSFSALACRRQHSVASSALRSTPSLWVIIFSPLIS